MGLGDQAMRATTAACGCARRLAGRSPLLPWAAARAPGSARMMASGPPEVRSAIVDDVADLDFLMEKVMPMVQEYRLGNADTENKVVEFLKPWDLLKELEGLDKGLPDEGTDLDSIVRCLEKALRYSVRTGHPRYFDKLCHGCAGQTIVAVSASPCP